MSQAISQTNHFCPTMKSALVSFWAKNLKKIPKFGLRLVLGPVDWPLKELIGYPGAGSPATRARCRISGYPGPVPDIRLLGR